MRKISRKSNNIILEMGSANITIFANSLLLREPNIAVVKRGHSLELIAYGNEALKLIGKMPDHSYIVRPVEEGIVTNVDAMCLILKAIFSKYFPPKIVDNARVYVLVPCGLSIAERELMENTIMRVGKQDVTIIESLLGLIPYIKGGTLVALFGAGITEVGVIDNTGIVSGLSINLAGNTINDSIKNMTLEKYNLKISWGAAEKLKMNIGTLYENDTSIMEIIGQDLIDQKFRKVEIKAEHIRPSITYSYKKHVEILESLLTTIPTQTLAEVSENGVLIAGGGANMNGLTDFLTKYLHLPVQIAPRPEIAIVKGMDMMVRTESDKYMQILGNKR